MNVGIIAEKKEPWVEKLIEAFSKIDVRSSFIEIGETALSVEHAVPRLEYMGEPFEGFDAVFLQANASFMLFIEPLLNEITDRGVYCQIKPTSFNLLTSNPYLYATLNAKKIPIRKASFMSNVHTVQSTLEGYKFPVLLEAFRGLDKTQRMLIETPEVVQSFLKSIAFEFDILAIQEFEKKDMQMSLVVGDQVFTLQRKWLESELEHSQKGHSTTLNDTERLVVIQATALAGLDVAVVVTIGGKIVKVKSLVNFERFSKVIGVDIYAKIAQYYKNKISGEDK